MGAIILFGTFLVLLAVNIPIGLALGFSSVLTMIAVKANFATLPIVLNSNIGKFTLLAIPFFVLAGNVMEKAQISKKLIDLCDSFFGHKKGGLAIVCVVSACFFAAISGSGPATVAALGAVILPAMAAAGYDPDKTAATLAAAGSTGIVIPPSLIFVIYGSITGASIGKLFIAGIVPGILMGVALSFAALYIIRNDDIPIRKKATWKERGKATLNAFWGLMMPVIILGGIYGGFFTPTEAAAVAAFYGMIIGLFVYKTMNLKDLFEVFKRSAVTTGAMMFLCGCGGMFAWLCQSEGIAKLVTNILANFAVNKFMFIVIVNFVMLAAGCFLDPPSVLFIFLPIILPLAVAYNYDLVALGVLVTVNMSIGQITPPVGTNLFMASDVSGVKMQPLIRHIFPLIVSISAVLFLISFFPYISIFLPNILGA